MNKCLECDCETNNPKFCGRSCAATHNNRGVRRNGNPPTVRKCLSCKCETTNPKYCSLQCQQDHAWDKRKKKIEKTGKCPTTVITSPVTKRYLKETFGYKCSVCGIETWNETKITLEVDHINGKSKDNRVENLRFICPNCHSQTKTYKAKNKGNCDRSWRNRTSVV